MEIEKRAEGGTLVPVIISLDKTVITAFGGKEAYPVYLTIGNIPKALRKKVSFRSQVLIAYLPVDKLTHIENRDIRRVTTYDLYQACLADILEPLKKAGQEGVFWRTADGAIRRCHPIIAAFAVDHIEQANITGTLQTYCPICTCPSQELGNHSLTHALRDPEKTKAAINLQFEKDDPRVYTLCCDELKQRPVKMNWWIGFPFMDPYPCNTPDILHQISNGMIAHTGNYLETIIGRFELNFRSRILPLCFGIRAFPKGICELTNPTGMEQAHISSILVGLVNDFIPQSNAMPQENQRSMFSFSTALSRALRGLVDFANISQFHVATPATLKALQKALQMFHENSYVFIELGACKDLNYVKNHMMSHYVESITYKGATDNFNTQFTERLHIDIVKDAFRHTNRREELSQMIAILDRKEKLHFKELSINHTKGQQLVTDEVAEKEPSIFTLYIPIFPRHPARVAEKVTTIITLHQADKLATSLFSYLSSIHRQLHHRQLSLLSWNMDILRLDVYHHLKFCSSTSSSAQAIDYIYAMPAKEDKPARFDVALVSREGDGINSASSSHGFYNIFNANNINYKVYVLPESK
jgi:hypothetical protein